MVSVNFASYPKHLFESPFIARAVNRSDDGLVGRDAGVYEGDEEGGTASVEASPGDVVLFGQPHRDGRPASTHWAIVKSDGTLKIIEEAEALGRIPKADPGGKARRAPRRAKKAAKKAPKKKAAKKSKKGKKKGR